MNASTKEIVGDLVAAFKSTGRIVIVGASLAGLRAAEALRKEGFTGRLTIIGDEPEEPYDRPPLSKQLLKAARVCNRNDPMRVVLTLFPHQTER